MMYVKKNMPRIFSLMIMMMTAVVMTAVVYADDDVAAGADVISDNVVADGADDVAVNDVVNDDDNVAAENVVSDNVVADGVDVINDNVVADSADDVVNNNVDENFAADDDDDLAAAFPTLPDDAPPARQQQHQNQRRLDGIAAVVGSEIILQSEVEAYTFMRLSSGNINVSQVDMSDMMRESLENLIDNKALLVRAMEDTLIHVRNDEVESALNNHINGILRQNNITMEQFETHLRMQQGTTLGRFRADARRAIREQLFRQKLQQSVFHSMRVNRRDVENFFAEYADSLPVVGESFELFKFSLQLAPSDSVRNAAHESALAIHRRITSGEDFEDVARDLGDPTGGDFGFVEMGSTIDLTFENRVFALPVGRVSEPFESRFGFHIVQVVERRDRRVRLRQILVRVTPSDADIAATVATLDSLRASINSRADFEAAARAMSADHATRIRGGNMGWVTQFEMTPAVRDAVANLGEGELSAVVTDENIKSFYMVNARVDSRRLTLENDYNTIANMARDILAQRHLIDSVRRWRGRMFIDIRI